MPETTNLRSAGIQEVLLGLACAVMLANASHPEEFSDVVSLRLRLAGGASAHAPRLQVLQRHPQPLTARPGCREGAQL